jgi:hypothetical protein
MRHLKGYNQLFESQQELTQEQRDWLDGCTKGKWQGHLQGKWQVNPQTGLVDVEGDFDCSDQGLIDFKGVRFGEVSRDFNCFRNSLTSLEGAPQSVGGDFDCSRNKLTSLKGAPQSVGVDFDCSHNRLTSLEGAPQKARGYFACGHNMLTSLKGAPQQVRFDFNLSHNQLTSLEGAPRYVGGYLHCSGNPISVEGISNVIRRMSHHNVSLEQVVSYRWKTGGWDEIPEEDKPYLAKHNPDLSPEERRGYAALERLKTRVI